MGGHGLAGPEGADFLCRVVTDGEDKIHLGCAGDCEFVPVLAAQIDSRQASCFELFESKRIDAAGGKAARAVGGEVGSAFLVQDGFGHDGAGGVAGAEKENVVVIVHDLNYPSRRWPPEGGRYKMLHEFRR